MSGMFEGIRVLELAQYVFVPGAGALLADEGAEVIKIETADTGDPYRTLSIGDGRELAEVNIALEQNNRGKKSIGIDLKSAEGREVLLELVKTADVFLTSIRPDALARLNLDVDQVQAINPRIIYVRGNGFGYEGAERNKPGYDSTAFWTRSAFATVLRAPDQDALVSPRGALGDHTGSLSVAYGIAAALFKRERTGKGAVVETSLLATGMWVLSADITASQIPGHKSTMAAMRSAVRPMMRGYQTSDGRWIQFTFLHPDRYWADVCRTLELEDLVEDDRFKTSKERTKNGIECVKLFTDRIGERSWEAWKPRFSKLDAPWELAHTVDELLADPQAVANGYAVKAHMTDGKDYQLVAGPLTFNREVRKEFTRAPKLGEHTKQLLEGLYSPDEITRLHEHHVVK